MAQVQGQFHETLRVSVLPELEIGGAIGSSLHRVVGAIRLSDDRILVANGGSHELLLFDAQGSLLRRLGGEGEGPGQFLDLNHVAELGDRRIAALDVRLGRVTIFSRTGELERASEVLPRIGEGGGRITPHGFLANGSLVAHIELPGEGLERRFGEYPRSALTFRAHRVQPVLIDSVGKVSPYAQPMEGDERVSEMRMRRGIESMVVGGVGAVPLPFLHSLQVAVRDDVIVMGHTSLLRVVAYNEVGRPQSIHGGSPIPVEASTRAREEWAGNWTGRLPDAEERRLWRDRYNELISTLPSHPTRPAFRSLAVQEEGVVWVELNEPEREGDAATRWWIANLSEFGDPDAIALPPSFRPHDIGRDYVLGVWKDGLGVEYVRMYGLDKVEAAGS